MMRHPAWKRWIAAAVLLTAGLGGVALLATPGARAEADASAPRVGGPAPDLTLAGLAGESVSLAQLQGRPVVVNFWATWCPPCRAEMPDLEAAYRAHQDQGLAVVGVNVGESAVAVTAFRDRYGLTFPLALDGTGAVVRRYQVVPLPTSFFIDRRGVVRAIYKGQLDRERLEQLLAQIE